MIAEKSMEKLSVEKYRIPEDIKVFGFPVETFPLGIGDAFHQLISMLPPGDQRSYYGISKCTTDGIVYIAAAAETYKGEGEKYGYETYLVEKGDYLAETVFNWRDKTECIKEVFAEMFNDERIDRSKPCIEVYHNDDKMTCLVKLDDKKFLGAEFNEVMDHLKEIVSGTAEEQLNFVPFEGSWTAGQVVEHIIKVNAGFKKLLSGPLKETERAPDKLVETLRQDFLNFSEKNKSPESVEPKRDKQIKEELLKSIDKIQKSVTDCIQTGEMDKTCALFEIPVYGYLTRLEAINFALYHTKRHLHQLRNILKTSQA